ncbi:MAG: SDR family oxidoreductase [Candidatus Poribacteria bacterium]|nr:SDR family oxidoreductase [Candidatus Poribacteria bacterium]
MRISNLFSLDGKTALVTGPSRGIGRGIAIGLARAGANLALVARSESKLIEVQREIQSIGQQAEVFTYDLSQTDGIADLVADVSKSFGQIDILVNNAGTTHRDDAVDFPEARWDAVIEVNLKSVWLLSQEVGRGMVERGSGKIINIASLLSFSGGIRASAYAASKGGVAQLTKALANEWASKGVNVNAIAPGYIETDMSEALLADPVRAPQLMDRLPAGRFGTPDDLMGAAIFLASEAASYIHGHILTVDGGWMAR